MNRQEKKQRVSMFPIQAAKREKTKLFKMRRLRWIIVSIAFQILLFSLFHKSCVFKANAVHSRSANMQLSTIPDDYIFWKLLAHRLADLLWKSSIIDEIGLRRMPIENAPKRLATQSSSFSVTNYKPLGAISVTETNASCFVCLAGAQPLKMPKARGFLIHEKDQPKVYATVIILWITMTFLRDFPSIMTNLHLVTGWPCREVEKKCLASLIQLSKKQAWSLARCESITPPTIAHAATNFPAVVPKETMSGTIEIIFFEESLLDTAIT